MNRKGFSLIELLVVIAIIAILAAILFPTFQGVRLRTRETQCMTQMHDIYTALKVYKEDNNSYPASLFGFAESPKPPPSSADPGKFYDGTGNVQNMSQLFYKPLFNKQKYLNDNTKFLCPVTKDKDPTVAINAVYPTNIPTTSGMNSPLAGTNVVFTTGMRHNMGYDGKPLPDGSSFPVGNRVYYYKYDNYDLQPVPNATLDGPNSSGNYEVHYALDWTGATGTSDYAGFPNQMKYGDKADDSHTVMTWCNEHALNAGSSNVLVLTLSGQTKVVDKKAFYSKGPLNIFK